MYSYFNGKIDSVNSDSVVVDVNNIGYLIYVPNPFSYEEGKHIKYMYIIILEKMDTLYMGLKIKMNLNYL